MVCKNPIWIHDPNWLLNRSSVRSSLESDHPGWMQVPCGRCIACRIQRTREWTERIMSESFYHPCSCFVTLTYEDKYLPLADSGRQTLVKKHLQGFFKRLRSDMAYSKDERKIRYYAVGEYGENFQRPHYHAIIFGLDPKKDKELIEDQWPYGFVSLGDVSYESAQYVAGYVQKKLYGQREEEYEDSLPPFSLMSKNLGKQFVLENADVLGVGGSIPVGNNRRIHRSRYSDRILELSLDEKYALSICDDSSYWDDKVEPYYVEHFDGFVSFHSKEDQIRVLKAEARKQFNLDLETRMGMREKKL